MANNAHPPMTLRVDLPAPLRRPTSIAWRRPAIDAYASTVVAVCDHFGSPGSRRRPARVRGGLVSVQDAGAQLAPVLLSRGRPCGCWMRARHRVARPGTSSSSSARAPTSPRSTSMPRARRADRGEPEAPEAHGALLVADVREPADVLGRAALRSDSHRCAVLLDRRHPPPSGHQAPAPRGDIAGVCRRAARHTAGRRHACSPPAGGCSTAPARCCRKRTSRSSRHSLGREPAMRPAGMRSGCGPRARGARSGRRGAAPAGS